MNEKGSYRSVASFATAEITEKKSRFIGEIHPVADMESVREILAKTEKKYHDARHHCFACVLGEAGDNLRSSDNGEPQGTAGKPILSVITNAELTNTLIVVTRYFGGTLLGTGGLTRTYTAAAQAALDAATIRTHTAGSVLSFRVPYALDGAISRYLRAKHPDAEKPLYENDVRYELFVSEADIRTVINDLTNICNGNIDISVGGLHFR